MKVNKYGAIALAVVLLFWAGNRWFHAADRSGLQHRVGVTESFFRIRANLLVEGEPLNFDVVVACSTMISRGAGENSYDPVGQYPYYYAVRTKNNHAVELATGNGCRGRESAAGRIPHGLFSADCVV